jgi:transcriptional regulator with XRE-family HTH domain
MLVLAELWQEVTMDGDASFGRWIQRRRQALHLTQAALAGKVYCSTETIRKIEADARRPSPSIAARLADQLALPPQLRAVFLKVAHAELSVDWLSAPTPISDPSVQRLSAPRPSNVPLPPTPLIGRAQEQATVRGLLCQAEVRLLTLVGPPGVGKTRLSLQVASDLQAAFADGVVVVALAPVRDHGLVASTIAQRLGVRESGDRPLLDQLKNYLREKQLLLLLDNFEQIVAAAPLVADLLATCPSLKVLVTSRVPLHLRGEKEIAVQPLALPDLQRLPPRDQLTQYAAVELFIQRALDVQRNFVVTNENAPAVAAICARLDGLPLALELAAARVKLFSPQALLSRLDNRLKFLTGGARDLPARQQTIRNTIDWSYELLDAGEQTLFARLGCSWAAALWTPQRRCAMRVATCR